MVVQIIVNQTGNPTPGDPGFARDDLILGQPVILSLSGGPFLVQQWSILDKPIDFDTNSQSSAGLVNPTSATTQFQPIDKPGTYGVRVLVDSGNGLGASTDDIAEIYFYAGPTLNATWNAIPRRIMGFLERSHFNVKSDPIFMSQGNRRGWAQEWVRWFGVIVKAYMGSSRAWARVTLTGAGATLLSHNNFNPPVRTGPGVVTFTFINQVANANYAVITTARGAVGGTAVSSNETISGFTIERADSAGVAIDADFNLMVLVG